jgi:hypothetical protein
MNSDLTIDAILSAIGSTEPSTFGEFCNALGDDCPASGDKNGWRAVLSFISLGERSGFITVDRVGGKIDSLLLTRQGADRVRSKLDAKRGLLGYLNQQGRL